MASSRKRVIIVIQILLALVVIGAVSWLGFKGYNYYSASQYFDAFEQTYVQETAKGKFQVMWKKFKKECPDAVAWLRVPGVGLSYPVMQGTDNEFYLHHDPQGGYVFVGSVFMDCNNESVADPHVILYGHNMIDGSMFGKLDKFTKESYMKKHPYVYILLPTGETLKYEVKKAYKADVEGKVYDLPSGVAQNPEDRKLYLSTCTEDSSDTQRFVVECDFAESEAESMSGKQ